MKILVVDDEPSILEAFGEAVEEFGYEVVKSDGTLTDFEDISEIEVILTDWMMPEISGIELVKRLKKKNPMLYIIMITAKGTQNDIFEGLVAGANDYMVKPINLDDLEVRLHLAKATIELNKAKRLGSF
jgi:DNA-binding response OmpR family regulator